MDKFVAFLAIGIIALAIGAIVLIPIVKLAGGCGRGYSDGDRSGVVVKISKKGLIWKSWEGEMLLGGMTKNAEGTMVPISWEFSIPKNGDDLAKQIADASNSGKRVTLSYEEYLIGPAQLSTGYVITKVTVQP